MNALLESSIAGENVQGGRCPWNDPCDRTVSGSRVRRSGPKSHPAHGPQPPARWFL